MYWKVCSEGMKQRFLGFVSRLGLDKELSCRQKQSLEKQEIYEKSPIDLCFKKYFFVA